MRSLDQNVLPRLTLEGRTVQKAVGKDEASFSKKKSMGLAHFSEDSGAMQPHHHAEEIVLVLSSDRSFVRYGPTAEQLGPAVPLVVGTILHSPELEWPIFECECGGHLEVANFYGQVDSIRPEDILDSGAD